MPIYEYECQNCNYSFEIEQRIKDKPKKKCPECKKMQLERLISITMGFVHGDINTIGQLADKNTKLMGKYKLSEEAEKNKAKQDPRKELHKKINKMTPRQKLKYIHEGD